MCHHYEFFQTGLSMPDSKVSWIITVVFGENDRSKSFNIILACISCDLPNMMNCPCKALFLVFSE